MWINKISPLANGWFSCVNIILNNILIITIKNVGIILCWTLLIKGCQLNSTNIIQSYKQRLRTTMWNAIAYLKGKMHTKII